MDEIDQVLISVAMSVGCMLVGIYLGSVSSITKYENKPYCVTATVNGKEFTRCLQAVEVPQAKEMK